MMMTFRQVESGQRRLDPDGLDCFIWSNPLWWRRCIAPHDLRFKRLANV